MRFGVFIPQGWRFDLVGIPDAEQWPLMRDLAHRADAGPWESIWVYDHFHTSPTPTEEATHEAWSLMAAFAASTERVRLGQMCTCAAYRPPMYLAKAAATIDHVSAGRMEMGIGAGWYEHEWRAYGYGFPRAGERLQMLEEGVQIMRQAWREGRASFTGRHYQVEDAICRPLPLQDGGVPLWIAGGGEKVTLRIAARYADCTNFDGTPEGFARKSAILAEHCREQGTDADRITRSANYNVAIGRDEAEVADRLDRYADRMRSAGVPEDRIEGELRSVRGMPACGTPEQIVENLSALRDQGLDYAICYVPRSEEHTSELQSRGHIVCRLLLEKT